MKKMMRKGVGLVLILLLANVAGATIVDNAAIYLPFEGVDSGLGSAAWLNQGTVGNGESTTRLGSTAPNPTVTANGLKGQAYDAATMAAGSSYMYGQFGSDTPMEAANDNIWSFTATFWVKSDALQHNKRILSTRNFEINYLQPTEGNTYLGTRIGMGSGYTNSSGNAGYDILDDWKFIAVTYDGTKASDQLSYYYGSETAAVSYDKSVTTSVTGQLVDTVYGGNLWIGNEMNYNGTVKLFDGYIDELRIFSSNAQSSDGALTLAQIEEVRQFDVVPEPATISLLGLGLIGLLRRRK